MSNLGIKTPFETFVDSPTECRFALKFAFLNFNQFFDEDYLAAFFDTPEFGPFSNLLSSFPYCPKVRFPSLAYAIPQNVRLDLAYLTSISSFEIFSRYSALITGTCRSKFR